MDNISMTFIIGNTLLVKDKIGSMCSGSVVGDTVGCINNLGSTSSNYVVGDTIVVWDKDIGLKTSSFSKIPADTYHSAFSGYGNFMWELLSIISSATRDNLGSFLIKRAINSDDLTISDISKVCVAEDGDVTFSGGVYTWNEPILTDTFEILADDNEIYLIIDELTVYYFNKFSGAYSLIGTLGGTNTRGIAFDGSYIYALDYAYDGNQYHHRIFKFKKSDLSIVATFNSSAAGGLWPPFAISGSSLWYSFAAQGGGRTTIELNISDLSLTGDSVSVDCISDEFYWKQGSNGSGLSWVYSTSISPHGWIKFYPESGTTTGAITIESEFL